MSLLLRLLLALLLFVPVASAQTGFGFDSAQGTRSGFAPAQGLPAASEEDEEEPWDPVTDMVDLVSFWDAGSDAKDAGHVVVSGYDLTPASDHYFSRTAGAIPGVSGGTPSYPLTIVAWFKPDAVLGNNVLWGLSDGSSTNRILLYRAAAVMTVVAQSSAGNTTTSTAASSVTLGRWHCAIVVLGAADARALYMDTDTTGATSSVSRVPTGIDQLHVGRDAPNATGEWDGVVGPLHVLPGDFSGAGFATERAAVFAGADPVSTFGLTADDVLAHYKFDNDAGADAKGTYGLTAQNTPTAQSNLLVLRDQVGSYHLRATTSAPTWSASAFSDRGGYVSGTNTFLVYEGAPITAAPFQVYAVAQSSDATALQGVVWLGDKDSINTYWVLAFSGNAASDPISFFAAPSGSAVSAASVGYTVDTAHLLWGLEASSTSRAARVDGGSEGTNTSSAAPAGADRLALGGFLDSTPGQYLAGNVGVVALLSTASTDDRADFHAWVNRPVDEGGFGLEIPE